MTRDKMKQSIINIIEDVNPFMYDDSGFYYPEHELDKAAEAILKLWEFGYTWEIKNDNAS